MVKHIYIYIINIYINNIISFTRYIYNKYIYIIVQIILQPCERIQVKVRAFGA